MPRADQHPQQEQRLKALQSLEILDTEQEPDFDDIVNFAAQLCGTAISIVNLVDAERQWFKAEIGLGLRETPLETSICAHAILEQEYLEIPDTRQDPRTRDNPLCTEDPGLRFYAGALLNTQDGLPLGTLCVLDRQPRRLTDLQREGLKVLARQVVAQLELRKALRQARLLRQEVDHRVKNSLQMLSSFVRISGRRAASAESRELLAVVQSRIDAMAHVHELLYRETGETEVELTSYLAKIGQSLAGNAPAGVTLEVRGDPVQVSPATAVAVATMTCEFVSNAFKHGFRDGRAGRVCVTLVHERASGEARLVCADDGMGMAQSPAPVSSGLGMQVAEVLATELSARIDVHPHQGGFTVSAVFPTRVAGA
ncbi:MAG: histidine kinase dimerization/phosphoacceptor domain -containing protein [Paracoccus sp. (in: a-proteobacteria)]|nr:histidine kinase dimerization/phosphoacceptor domain -containing protein [Paracoccus sp. (in: a-proteobacteria)]